MKKRFILDKQWLWFSISGILIGLGLFVMGTKLIQGQSPFNLGIDFTGGISLMLDVQTAHTEFEAQGNLSNATRSEINTILRDIMTKAGIQHLQLTTVDQIFFSLKIPEVSNDVLDTLIASARDKLGEITILETDYIGPTIGNELKQQSIAIIGIAILLLLIYITFRFEFWAAISAILALLHDALIVLGLTALLGLEVNTAFVAAILTILGYSINDTIVIFDRIRENGRQKKVELGEIVETGIEQTIVRSINTSMTTLVVLLSIYLFGGASLKDFSLVLLIGITSGTYSSIFIASPILYQLKKLTA